MIRFGDGIVVFEEDAHGIGHTAIQRGRRVLVDDEEDEDDDMAPYGGRNERWQSRGTGWQQRGRGMHRPRGRPPGSTREREIVMGRQESARLQEVEFDDLVTSRGLGRGNRKARGGAGIGPSRTAHSWRDAHGMGKEEEGESQESQEMNAQDFLNAVAKTMREASRPDSWGPSVSSGESRPRGRPGGAGAARGRRTADSSLRPAARRGPGRPRKAAESNEALHGRCFEETGDEEDGTSTLSSLLPRSEGQTTVGRRGRPPKDKSAGSLGAPPTSQVSRGPGRPKKAAVDDRWDWGVVDDITSVGAGVSSLASRLDKFAVAGPSGEVRAPTSRQRASALEGAGACAGSGRGRPRKVEDTVLKEEGWGSGWTVASVHQATERRGRGRPRKDAAAVDASTLEDSVATERRGRGRPRKDAAEADASTLEDSVATESVATERRGRGRPRKDAAEADASTLEDSVATERRGRGRPRKDAAEADASTLEDSVATESVATERRGRGRPRKDAAAVDASTLEDSVTTERRGRGRPRKDAAEADASTLEDSVATESVATERRGRGRPRKDAAEADASTLEDSVATERRGRGRPRKDAAEADASTLEDSVTTERRGRGRPRKDAAEADASTLEDSVATESVATERRGRGRPRKDAAEADASTLEDSVATERRGRGRPRKDAAEADASTLEDSVTTERRGRGRPRKDAAEADASTLEDSVATESVATERRGRGRPRKDAAEADASTLEDSVATERRGRGRPRKDAAAVDSLVEARVEALSGKVRSRGRPRRTSLQGDLSRSRGVPGGASLARKLSDEEIGWESEIVVSATPLANIGAGKEWGRPDTYAGEDILIQAAASEMERGSQQLRRGRGWLSKERSSDVTVAIDEANSSYSSMLEQEDDGRQADSSNFGDAPRRVDSHDEDLRRSDAHQKDDIATGENSADGLSSPGGMLVERNAESVEWNIAREGDVGVDWSNDAEESGEKEKAKGSLVPAIISADKVDGLVREAVQRGLRHPGSPLRVENKLPVLSPLRAGSISPMRRMHGHSAETTDEPEDSAEAVEESTKKDAREVYHGSAVLEEDVPDAADAEQQWELDEGQGHALSCGRGKDEVGVGMGLGKVWWRIRTLAGGGPAQRG